MEPTCQYCHGAVVAFVDTKGKTVVLCSDCKRPVPDPEDIGLREQLDGPTTE